MTEPCINQPIAGPIAGPLEADKSGWARHEVWQYDAASTGGYGDNAVGLAYESLFQNGNHFVEVAYFIVCPRPKPEDGGEEDGDGELFIEERTYTYRRDEDGDPYDEAYEYEHVGYTVPVDLAAAELEARTMALQDLRPYFDWPDRVPYT